MMSRSIETGNQNEQEAKNQKSIIDGSIFSYIPSRGILSRYSDRNIRLRQRKRIVLYNRYADVFHDILSADNHTRMRAYGLRSYDGLQIPLDPLRQYYDSQHRG